MRSFFAVAVPLLGLLAAGCGTHHDRVATAPRQRPAPPQIHESFTLLPCPRKPRTTVQLEGCAEAKLLRSDRAIEGEAETVFSLVAPTGRRAFVTAERSWLAYRRAICDAESSRYAGGTLEPLAFADCEVALNLRHLDDLGRLEGRLRSR